MANAECHGRILVLGHSFVSRLNRFLECNEVEVCGHRVTFLGIGGATVEKLMEELNTINLASFCTVYLEISTNDLCSSSAEIVVSKIRALVEYLRTRRAPQVIFGQVLYRTRSWVRGTPVQEFRRRVRHVNSRMEEWMGERGDVFFLIHQRLHSPGQMARDGVHFSNQFQSKLHSAVTPSHACHSTCHDHVGARDCSVSLHSAVTPNHACHLTLPSHLASGQPLCSISCRS